MGCLWNIRIWDDIDSHKKEHLQSYIKKATDDFDKKYSRFIDDSLVLSRLRSSGEYSVPEDLVHMLKHYKNLYLHTDKKFTPLVGQILSDLGYDQNYSLKPKEALSVVPEFEHAIEIIDAHTIRINEPILLDLGGLGKGYWVDKIRGFLRSSGLKIFLIDGSGDMFFQSSGHKFITVGLEHPYDPSKAIGTISLSNKALCGSGANKRSWRGIHHIIDPFALKSTDSIIASWVMADTTVYADALATCLFLISPEKLKKIYSFEYLILGKDMSAKYSKGFNVEIFS